MRRLLIVALAAACQALPEPLTRVERIAPAGTVAPGEVVVEVRFTAPVSPDGLADGRRAALCRSTDAPAVAAAASAEAGIPAGAQVVPAAIELTDGGLRLVLRPERPLWPMASWALVLGKGIRDAEGRPVLDPAGRQRAVVHPFETGDLPAGALPALALVEALAQAAAPAAGGEYAEVENLGSAPADLAGFRLAKRTASGAEVRCTLEPMAGAAVAAGGRGLLVGGAWDGRHAVPAGTPHYRCGASAFLGGLADDRPVSLRLESPGGAPLSGLGWDAAAPRCAAAALVRLDPGGPDQAANLACGAPSPGS
ncbi:MAG: lamin tail domain-containing protein [Deltaproteobacteria bacterium]|nr:lamin tail domain-containing protein [Deltaproteobacteria bacterium]